MDGGDGVGCYGAELAKGGVFKGGEGGKEGGVWAEEFGECDTVEVNEVGGFVEEAGIFVVLDDLLYSLA